MVSLLQIRDLVALYGQADLDLLSEQLKAPKPLIQAMVDKLIAMGKLKKVDLSACLTGTSCKGCPESNDCSHYVLTLPDALKNPTHTHKTHQGEK
ncbi:ferrous iron transporter C [Providencia stuartii]|uniref:FeoC-like transcriptional regulator n=1 Tax=Providencia TaxID=586 RepID=UPI0009BD501F|nr:MULTISPECIES: FeoC-like transcriptional regulator [Providencia]ELR5299955.1 ferrous iron transporter C [Providencia stuartii]MDV5227445.1 FeoC-like transcriptional regulator [Providencia rettgeri]MDW7589032.1 FeoC-like transcriptional regulator [Providencia sp. 2023EL-00965]MDX4946680.1 FeoC-like transcriptional regulator [Providencia manganoxydans]